MIYCSNLHVDFAPLDCGWLCVSLSVQNAKRGAHLMSTYCRYVVYHNVVIIYLAALPISANSNQIRQGQPITFAYWWQSTVGQSRQETRPTNCGQLPILRTSSRSHNIDGVIQNFLSTSSTHWKYYEARQPFSWLHVDTFICSNQVPCLWHDPQCSFWRILLLGTKSTELSWWLFLPRQLTTQWWPH